MNASLEKFAYIIMLEVQRSQRYWWASIEARKFMSGPRFDKNQIGYLLELHKDMGGELPTESA